MAVNSSPVMNTAIGVAPGVPSMTRFLGLVSMVLSPGLLLSFALSEEASNGFPRLEAFMGLLFTIGWFCNVLGLWQLRATGTRWPGRMLLGIGLFGIVLAGIFQLLEITGFGERTIFYTITDIAWPLSMVIMLIIGITVASIGGLRGGARFVPLIAPLWLPIAILSGLALGEQASLIISGTVATLGWFLTGYVIFQGGGFTKRA